jgi:uncharacterized protein (DUF302 family)
MLEVLMSNKTVTEIAQAFPEVCARRQFGVLGTIDLRQKLNDKGLSFDRECLIFEVCNPQQAKKVLDANIALSTALPCRISVYQEGGKSRIATLKPTALLALFPHPELAPVAREVERAILQIMRDLV